MGERSPAAVVDNGPAAARMAVAEALHQSRRRTDVDATVADVRTFRQLDGRRGDTSDEDYRRSTTRWSGPSGEDLCPALGIADSGRQGFSLSMSTRMAG